ncbi:MAG: hypothetical protein M3Y48_12495 [Actinomycetota bacterium]|nr:hypothetical protein [Actinomycetota bacterium]
MPVSASRLHRWLNAGRASLLTAGLVVLLAACSTISWAALGIGTGADGRVIPVLPSTSPPPPRPPVASVAALPGMPAVTDWRNVYAAGARGMLSATAERAKELVYVPHSKSGDVWVIDPSSFQVIATYPAGIELQHVVPSYDLRTLYATDDRGNAVLPFDPTTGKPGAKIPVVDPYNRTLPLTGPSPSRSPRGCGRWCGMTRRRGSSGVKHRSRVVRVSTMATSPLMGARRSSPASSPAASRWSTWSPTSCSG